MKKFTCIIIDDEPLAIDKLTRFIEKENSFIISAKYTSVTEAEKTQNFNNVDLIFLDVQMPLMSGMDLAKKNKITRPIIFTTAYDKYAVESFDLNVVDYLLKPYTYERFEKACKKAIDRLLGEQNKKQDPGFIIINSEHQVFKINYNDILYIEGLKDYVKIHTLAHDKPILTRQNLKKIGAQLPEDLFIRVHRSYIVALNKIQKVAKQKLIIHGTDIPLGDLFKDDFLQRYFK